ncbi:MAG: TatD family hydrolase [Pseudomonadales bacterium]
MAMTLPGDLPHSPSPIIDIGTNLTHSSFSNDYEAVIKRAASVGVSRILVTGTNIVESQHAAQLATEYPTILNSTAGIHPHHAKDFQHDSSAKLKKIAASTQVKAIGECGLDFNRMFSSKKEQLRAFEQQIELAIELQLPLFLHERDAHNTQREVLTSYRDQFLNAVVHCFTGEKHEAFHYLDLDLYIGITGWICDERRGAHLHEFVGDIPLNRLLIETDAPYLTPKVKPKPKLKSTRRNEPCTLPYVLTEIAKHSEYTVEAIAHATTDNATRLFRLDNPRKIS